MADTELAGLVLTMTCDPVAVGHEAVAWVLAQITPPMTRAEIIAAMECAAIRAAQVVLAEARSTADSLTRIRTRQGP